MCTGLLAKRYHPDNTASGNVDRFTEVRRAYEVLSSTEGRATYDVKYDTEKSLQWQIFEQGAAMDSHEHDRRVFHGILSLLYVARRRSPDEGGGGTRAPQENAWHPPRASRVSAVVSSRRRGWVEILPNGLLAITVDGVDRLGSKELALPHDRLLTESSAAATPDAGGAGTAQLPGDHSAPGNGAAKDRG